MLCAGPSEAVRRQASGSCLLVVTLALALSFVLVGCRAAQETGPATVPTESPLPSSVEAGTGPTQDGRLLAARVSGQPIFLDVYEKQVAQTEQALIEQGLILEGEAGQAQLTQIRQNVLNGLIEQAIIEQAAAAAGISVTDEELEATVRQSIAMGQGQQSFDQWLTENDLTLEEFREIQRSQLLATKMIEHVTAVVPNTAEQVHARHILVSDPTQAQSLVDELRGGANFSALAQRASEDLGTAANGGDLGWFPRDVPLMPPPVVETAFVLQPGDISSVIESDQGYHIIKVEAREANRPLAPDMLLYGRQSAFEAWLAQQRENAAIEQHIDM